MAEQKRILTEQEMTELDPTLEYGYLHSIKASFPYEDMGSAYEEMLIRRYDAIRTGHYIGTLEEEVDAFKEEIEVVTAQSQALRTCINLMKTSKDALIVGRAQQLIEMVTSIPIVEYLEEEKNVDEKIKQLRLQNRQIEEEAKRAKKEPVLEEYKEDVTRLKEEAPEVYDELIDKATESVNHKVNDFDEELDAMYQEADGIHKALFKPLAAITRWVKGFSSQLSKAEHGLALVDSYTQQRFSDLQDWAESVKDGFKEGIRHMSGIRRELSTLGRSIRSAAERFLNEVTLGGYGNMLEKMFDKYYETAVHVEGLVNDEKQAKETGKTVVEHIFDKNQTIAYLLLNGYAKLSGSVDEASMKNTIAAARTHLHRDIKSPFTVGYKVEEERTVKGNIASIIEKAKSYIKEAERDREISLSDVSIPGIDDTELKETPQTIRMAEETDEFRYRIYSLAAKIQEKHVEALSYRIDDLKKKDQEIFEKMDAIQSVVGTIKDERLITPFVNTEYEQKITKETTEEERAQIIDDAMAESAFSKKLAQNSALEYGRTGVYSKAELMIRYDELKIYHDKHTKKLEALMQKSAKLVDKGIALEEKASTYLENYQELSTQRQHAEEMREKAMEELRKNVLGIEESGEEIHTTKEKEVEEEPDMDFIDINDISDRAGDSAADKEESGLDEDFEEL